MQGLRAAKVCKFRNNSFHWWFSLWEVGPLFPCGSVHAASKHVCWDIWAIWAVWVLHSWRIVIELAVAAPRCFLLPHCVLSAEEWPAAQSQDVYCRWLLQLQWQQWHRRSISGALICGLSWSKKMTLRIPGQRDGMRLPLSLVSTIQQSCAFRKQPLQCFLTFLQNQTALTSGRASQRQPSKPDECAGFLFDVEQVELLNHSVFWLSPPGSHDGDIGWDAKLPRTCETAVFKIHAAHAASAVGPQPELKARVQSGLKNVLRHTQTQTQTCWNTDAGDNAPPSSDFFWFSSWFSHSPYFTIIIRGTLSVGRLPRCEVRVLNTHFDHEGDHCPLRVRCANHGFHHQVLAGHAWVSTGVMRWF